MSLLYKLPEPIKRIGGYVFSKLFPVRYKEARELAYWRRRLESETSLANAHYRYFYTEYFGLDPSFYSGKAILDVGCGPRGSLEWADQAAERVGLDSLAAQYLKMGASAHRMRYVAAPAEAIPFADAHFDVVCSFNSLDHVADLERALGEIHRVLKPDGVFLLIVEINHEPTPTEPVEIGGIESIAGTRFRWRNLRTYEIGPDHDIYGQLRADRRYDESDRSDRPAIATAILTKIPR